MSILLVPVPVFSSKMSVEAYKIKFCKGNDLMPARQIVNMLDGIFEYPILKIIERTGIEAFGMDKPVLIPIAGIVLLLDLETKYAVYKEHVIFLLDSEVVDRPDLFNKVLDYRKLEFRFAIIGPNATKICDANPGLFELFLIDLDDLGEYREFRKTHPKQRAVITGIDTFIEFKALEKERNTFFEGGFYNYPLTMGNHEVSPLKTNLVRLLNTVRDENIDFDQITKIIQTDAALTISLMQIVNSASLRLPNKVKNIQQAVAFIGEEGLKKWVVTAVSRLLGSDKPDEITKLSLIRAKFAENLALSFDLMVHNQSLFLMGLFSCLDIILDIPMEEALNRVFVTDDIRKALVDREGKFGALYDFIRIYERGEWKDVSRFLIVHDIDAEGVSDAYIDAMIWFKELLQQSDSDYIEDEELKNSAS